MSKDTLALRIIELRAQGISIAAICARLGISRASYYRYVAETAKG
jgi:hypothetical protein